MINDMQSGSVIYDLAAVQGGNAAYTEADKIIEKEENRKKDKLLLEIIFWLCKVNPVHNG